MNTKINHNKVYDDNNFINWSNEWKQRILKNNNSKEKSIDLMKMSNPTVIPRNHKVEEALNSVKEGNLEILNKLLSVLKKPYSSQKTIEDYQLPSTNNSYQTFCGT
jgi:uncharacterized protein YdiU (UPF0061 family)